MRDRLIVGLPGGAYERADSVTDNDADPSVVTRLLCIQPREAWVARGEWRSESPDVSSGL